MSGFVSPREEMARRLLGELMRTADWDPESGVVTLKDRGERLECRSEDELRITLLERAEGILGERSGPEGGGEATDVARRQSEEAVQRYRAQIRAMGWKP